MRTLTALLALIQSHTTAIFNLTNILNSYMV